MPVLALNPARPTGATHHRRTTVRDHAGLALDPVGRLGQPVTPAALLVLAGAVGGLFDGSWVAAMTVTFGHR